MTKRVRYVEIISPLSYTRVTVIDSISYLLSNYNFGNCNEKRRCEVSTDKAWSL